MIRERKTVTCERLIFLCLGQISDLSIPALLRAARRQAFFIHALHIGSHRCAHHPGGLHARLGFSAQELGGEREGGREGGKGEGFESE
jgi:hypothetical protein